MLVAVGHFLELSRRLRWDAEAIGLERDGESWGALDPARRRRLETLIAGFCLAEARVADDIEPFVAAAGDPVLAAALAAQQADEERHRDFFDRVAERVLGLPAAGPAELAERAPPAVRELFAQRLPEMAASIATGKAEIDEGVALYHLVLEGIVLSAGQQALLAELADGALPGLREGVERVTLDERWHIGLGVRCTADGLRSDRDSLTALLAEAEASAAAWGEAVPKAIAAGVAAQHGRRLGVARRASAAPVDARA